MWHSSAGPCIRVSAADVALLKQEHATTLGQARAADEALERRLSDLVNTTYGLTPEEVQLMWDTAPVHAVPNLGSHPAPANLIVFSTLTARLELPDLLSGAFQFQNEVGAIFVARRKQCFQLR